MTTIITKQTQQQMIGEMYAYEEELLKKSLPDRLDTNFIKKANAFINKYGFGDIKGLQEFLNSNGASPKLKVDGVLGKKTLLALFKEMHKEALAGNEDAKYILYDLRKIVYPYVNDEIANAALKGAKADVLAYLGIESIKRLQTNLANAGLGDYNNNPLVADGIFGKRTFSAFISNIEGFGYIQMKAIAKKVAPQEKITLKEMYLTLDDIDQLNLPNEYKTQIKGTLGCKYKYGSASPKYGFDCSGLVAYLFEGVLKTYKRYPSTGYIYDNTVPIKKFDFNNTKYPVILAASKRVLGTEHGHAVIDYGPVEKDGKKYHVILEASGSKGKVVCSLVPEESMNQKYSKYGVLTLDDYQTVVDKVRREEERKLLAAAPTKKRG